MQTIELPGDASGSLSIRYGVESRYVLIEVHGILLTSARGLREMALALVRAASELDARMPAAIELDPTRRSSCT